MSRLGKKPISIPESVEVKIEGQKVFVKGPKGELSLEIRPEINIRKKDGEILLNIKEMTR
jgi:large subunit ribosomal protein L6